MSAQSRFNISLPKAVSYLVCLIRVVLEAAGSQLIALLSRVVVGEFFLLGAGNLKVIPNSFSSPTFFNSIRYPIALI